MAIDTTIMPLLAYWVKQQKEAERDKAAATEDGKTWLRRAKLAMNKGEQELAQLASEEAFAARDRFRKAEARLFIIEQEKELLKAGARDHGAAFREAERRTQHAIAEFAKLGIDVEFAALEFGPADALTERDVLARLRSRMEADVRRASGVPSPGAPPAVPAEPPAVSTDDATAEPSTDDEPPIADDALQTDEATLAPSVAPNLAADAPAMDDELRALLDEIDTLHKDPT